MTHEPLVFHLIPHTHWDREWYLPLATLRVRLAGMLDDVIARMEHEPAIRSFTLDGQTVLIEDYLQLRPEREEVVANQVRDGRLEIGPWYVLADEQIVSGEALIRNLLAGRRLAERLGRRSDVLYSPDAFGHPAILPDLAHEFGIEHGVIWRGLGSAGGIQRDLWMWRGPAGGSLLVYHLPSAGYEIGGSLPADAERLPAVWDKIRHTLVARACSRHIAVFVGADHHRIHPNIPQLRDLLASLERPNEVRVSRLDEFLSAAADSATGVLELTGELRHSYGYTWTLQGVHATHAPLKRWNSQLELGLERLTEPLVALAGGDDLRAALRDAWGTLIQNHFHDSICGTGSDAVAHAMRNRFAEVEAAACEIRRRAWQSLLGHDPDRVRDGPEKSAAALALWNPAARTRNGIVIADLTFFRRDVLVGPPGGRQPQTGTGFQQLSLRGSSGETIPVQVLDRRIAQERVDADRHYPDQDEVDRVRVAFRAPEVAGLGLGVLQPAPATTRVTGDVVADRNSLRNRLVQVRLERDGSISLRDQRSGERFSALCRLESGGDVGDTYTYCAPAGDRIRISRGPARVRVVTSGPLVGSLEATWSLALPTGRVDARLLVQLQADDPLVRCVLTLDNQACDHRLRARLPLGLSGAQLVTGTQFGAVMRPAAHDREHCQMETPVRTAPAHRFAAAAMNTRGLALLTPGFFEVEWDEGDLLFTLLRSVGELSRGDLPTRPGHAGWPQATPAAQCHGLTRVAFALAPIVADDLTRGDALPALWEDAFVPLQPSWLRHADTLAPSRDSVTLEGDGLVLSAVKPTEEGDAIVLRCYNATSDSVEGRWCFGLPRSGAYRVRADEREPLPASLTDRGRVLAFRAGPHQWVTHVVARADTSR